jgi:hypothetical protein
MASQLGHLAGSLLEMIGETIRVKVCLDATRLWALVRLVGGVGVAAQTLPLFGIAHWTC